MYSRGRNFREQKLSHILRILVKFTNIYDTESST